MSSRFCRHCWQNVRVGEVEASHSVEVAPGEPTSEAGSQVCRQSLHENVAISCLTTAPLFDLHDLTADLPVGGRHDGVHGTGGGAAGRLQQHHDLAQQAIVVGGGNQGVGVGSFPFRHQNSLPCEGVGFFAWSRNGCSSWDGSAVFGSSSTYRRTASSLPRSATASF